MIRTIIQTVCREYGVNPDELQQRTRKQRIVLPRKMCSYFIRKHSNLSFDAIGDLFKLDHATVMYSINYINDSCMLYKDFASKLQYLSELIDLSIARYRKGVFTSHLTGYYKYGGFRLQIRRSLRPAV